jgi:hypothetical protein
VNSLREVFTSGISTMFGERGLVAGLKSQELVKFSTMFGEKGEDLLLVWSSQKK